ncbi:aldolase [Ramaria rubella]|nr:aldolase [Ramaria rubella]
MKSKNGLINLQSNQCQETSYILDLLQTPQLAGLKFLDTISPHACMTESQLHRITSGSSFPIGFKNGTDSNMSVAVNAMCSASSPYAFMRVTTQGLVAIFKMRGNTDMHIILCGGSHSPTYGEAALNLLSLDMPGKTLVTLVGCVQCCYSGDAAFIHSTASLPTYPAKVNVTLQLVMIKKFAKQFKVYLWVPVICTRGFGYPGPGWGHGCR